MARGTDEIAEHGDVGTVGADAARIHRKTELFGLIEIDAGIIEFRKTEPSGRLHTIHSGGIDRARRAVALPGTARQLVELLPIAFVPLIHG